MPTLSSLFNNNNTHKDHSSCCSCNCHDQDNSTIIFTPTRWFPRIRRRSSSSSSCTTVSYEDQSSRRVSSEYIVDIEDKQILEFERLYSLAVDEV